MTGSGMPCVRVVPSTAPSQRPGIGVAHFGQAPPTRRFSRTRKPRRAMQLAPQEGRDPLHLGRERRIGFVLFGQGQKRLFVAAALIDNRQQ